MTSAIPKVELHCHVEGAAPPALVRRLAKRHGVDVSRLFDDAGAYAWSDFTSFIKAYDGAAQVFQTAEDYADLAETYLAASAAMGVIYTEFFISPDHARRIGIPYADYVGGLVEGMRRAEAAHGIVGRLIPLIERHFGPEIAVEAARTAVAHRVPEVVGFGMAGDERLHTVADFVPAFRIAAEAGLPLTCHAGEVCGAESVRATLDAIPVRRIGHGVRAIEDPALVARLAEEGIVLECCPGSNIALKVFESFEDHSFKALRDAGVAVTLSSDDPPFFFTDMAREYRIARDHLGQTEADLVAITATAVEAAFCDETVKKGLRERLERGLSAFQTPA